MLTAVFVGGLIVGLVIAWKREPGLRGVLLAARSDAGTSSHEPARRIALRWISRCVSGLALAALLVSVLLWTLPEDEGHFANLLIVPGFLASLLLADHGGLLVERAMMRRARRGTN